MDSGSCENVVLKSLDKALQLDTHKHPNLYKIGWIKRGAETSVTELIHIFIHWKKNYLDTITCDVVEMDACHILLSRPWQFDKHVVHNGRANTYSFQWHHKKLVLIPSKPHTPFISNPNQSKHSLKPNFQLPPNTFLTIELKDLATNAKPPPFLSNTYSRSSRICPQQNCLRNYPICETFSTILT